MTQENADIQPQAEPHIVKSHDIHIDADYAEWIADIKSRYRSAQVKAAVKVNAEKLLFNWQLGRDLVQKKAEERWGAGVVEQVSLDLKREFPNAEGFSTSNCIFTIILYNGSMRRRCVSMALPGTPGQRISDLCNGNHITQKELAEKIGVSASQLSRIVSGETRTVSSDILIGVAKEFKVSTDYILGLSTVSVRKSYDISELGLSEGAVRGLVTGAVDVQILNRLLEHRNFPKLIDLIRIYFQDTAAKGITARNQLIEIATASLSDLMKEHPEHRAEAKQDLQLLNAQKMGEHEAEIEKIKNVFLAILRDIKKDIDNGEQPGEAVTAAMFQAMRDALAEQKQNPLSIDDVAAMVAGQIGQLTPMDEETADLFKQLAKKMMKGIE